VPSGGVLLRASGILQGDRCCGRGWLRFAYAGDCHSQPVTDVGAAISDDHHLHPADRDALDYPQLIVLLPFDRHVAARGTLILAGPSRI
jgi:hypothetical protein